jgi:predicted nucleic acid-binding protein
MLSDLVLYYWDACVPLSYINGIKERLPDIEGLLQKSGTDFQLITSIFSTIEVAFARAEQDSKATDPQTEEKIAKLWGLGSPILKVELYEVIADKARKLIRNALPEGWSLKPGDALHLATADHFKVSEFHTYDEGLEKYQKITETHFKICKPIAAQPVIVLTEHGEPNAAESGQKDNEFQADPAHTAPLQGSDSGRAQGKAPGEK